MTANNVPRLLFLPILRSFHGFHTYRAASFHEHACTIEMWLQLILVGDIDFGFYSSGEAVKVRVGGDIPATMFHNGHARHIAPKAVETGVSRQRNARAPVGEFGDADDVLSLPCVQPMLVLSITVAYADVATIACIDIFHYTFENHAMSTTILKLL